MRWLAALAVVIGVLVVAGCADPQGPREGPTARERIEATADADVPLAVPTELPDGYGFVGGHGVNRRHGEAVASLWLYAVEGEASDPPVHVCVLAPSADESACPSSSGAEPIELEAGRYRVLVASADIDHPEVEAWESAEFTPDWKRVDWIDAPAIF